MPVDTAQTNCKEKVQCYNIMRLSRYRLLSSLGGKYAIKFGQGKYELLSSMGTVQCSTAVIIVSHYCPSTVYYRCNFITNLVHSCPTALM
jgi:hypothetical protein